MHFDRVGFRPSIAGIRVLTKLFQKVVVSRVSRSDTLKAKRGQRFRGGTNGLGPIEIVDHTLVY